MGAYPVELSAFQPGAFGMPQSRVVVVEDLNTLTGPIAGEVELPLELDWSGDPVYNLNDDDEQQSYIQAVLREARSPAELSSYINKSSLMDFWRELNLSDALKGAWESKHPILAS